MKYLSPRSISNHQIGFLLSYVSYWPSFVSGINLRYFINKTWQASFTSVFPKIHLRDNAGKDHIFHFQGIWEEPVGSFSRTGSKVTITECKNKKNLTLYRPGRVGESSRRLLKSISIFWNLSQLSPGTRFFVILQVFVEIRFFKVRS